MTDPVDPREAAALLHELAVAFRPIVEKIEQAEAEQRREAAKKQHATGPGSHSASF